MSSNPPVPQIPSVPPTPANPTGQQVRLTDVPTPWWQSSVIRAAAVSILSWLIAYATQHKWISIPLNAETIVDPLLTLMGAGAGVFAIFKRVNQPINQPISGTTTPATKTLNNGGTS